MDAARRLALRAGYRNAGHRRVPLRARERRFSFMEVNARLQVEHPVTEKVTGARPREAPAARRRRRPAGGRAAAAHGHAIEARLNAEDPARGFAPAPGRIALLRLPTGPGVRVDTGVAEGDRDPAPSSTR